MSPTFMPDQVELARVMRANGAPYAVIAAQFGVSVSGVRYRLDPHIPACRRRLTDEEKAQIRELRAEGATVNELCARFGVGPTTVRTHAAEPKNVTPRPKPPTPPTRDELLLSAYPWAYRLPLPMRERFGFELSHRPSYEYEHQLDAFIRRWRITAEQYRRTA